VTARQIQMEVCAAHGVSRDLLIDGGNQPKFVAARGEAMNRCRDELGMSAVQIGRLFRRHHTTVLHAIAQYRQRNPAGASHRSLLVRQARVIAEQGHVIAEQARQIEALAGEVERKHEAAQQSELFEIRRGAA